MARVHPALSHAEIAPEELFFGLGRHREAALAAVAIHWQLAKRSQLRLLDCFAEFTPDHDPGLAMT